MVRRLPVRNKDFIKEVSFFRILILIVVIRFLAHKHCANVWISCLCHPELFRGMVQPVVFQCALCVSAIMWWAMEIFVWLSANIKFLERRQRRGYAKQKAANIKRFKRRKFEFKTWVGCARIDTKRVIICFTSYSPMSLNSCLTYWRCQSFSW